MDISPSNIFPIIPGSYVGNILIDISPSNMFPIIPGSYVGILIDLIWSIQNVSQSSLYME